MRNYIEAFYRRYKKKIGWGEAKRKKKKKAESRPLSWIRLNNFKIRQNFISLRSDNFTAALNNLSQNDSYTLPNIVTLIKIKGYFKNWRSPKLRLRG